MNALEQLALACQGSWLTLRAMRTGRLWAPWLALGALQSAALLALVGFAHPLLAWAVAPLVRAVGGEQALHYPDFFRSLPFLYSRAGLVLGALAGAIASGWSTRLFAAHWRRHPEAPGEAWAEAAPHALALVLGQALFTALVLAFTRQFALVFVDQPGLVRRIGALLALGGVAALQALFLYFPALVVLEHHGLWRALGSLPRTWARGFWSALLLAAASLLLLLPLDALGQRSDLLVSRGTPELVAWLTGVQLLVGLVVSFLLAGSSTLVYLGAVAGEPGAEG